MVSQELIEKLKQVLKELFQFENNDLDFGIYRIINIKRKEISNFIEKELFDIIKKEIRTVKDNESLKKELEDLQKEIEKTFGCDLNDAIKKYHETPKIKEFIKNQKQFEKQTAEIEVEEFIYNNIINFFSRYYENGDFISKRRYSINKKYAIPYNGEEVLLYWANNDQYYIKTAENFKSYSFKVGKWKINFETINEDIDLEKANIKENNYFIFNNHISSYSDIVSIHFAYRCLTSEEREAVKMETGKKIITKETVNNYNLKKLVETLEISTITELKEKHHKLNGELSEVSELEWHLNKYTTKNKADYFIHKNLKSFLSQELDFYIKNEFFQIDNLNTLEELNLDLRKIKAFKTISLKIVEFLSQIENFQKKLWEKKKFIVETNYLITLDLIDKIYYPKILQNLDQLKEWNKLFNFDINKVTKNSSLSKFVDNGNKNILEDYPTLVLDTKFFEVDFKYELISKFQNLDDKLTGILIKSENYHQLDLFLQKYREKINCIYIDPPYNTGSDEFLYKDGYIDSSWLSFLKDRLMIAPFYLQNNGVIFVSIDYHEFHNLKILMQEIFGKQNHLSDLVWYLGTGTTAGHFVRSHENIIAYSKNKAQLENFDNPFTGETIKHGALKKISKANPASIIEFPAGMEYEGQSAVFQGEIGGSEKMYIISDKMEFEDGKLRFPTKVKAGWGFRDQILNWISGNETFDTKGQKVIKFYFKSSGILAYEKEKSKINPKSVLKGLGSTQNGTDAIKDLFGECELKFPKPINLIRFLTTLSTGKGGIIFDYFAGSGTTGHAVINQNKKDGKKRKFILVEMANYFDTILKPRIEKVIFSDYDDENKNWKNGKPLKICGSKGQIIKYHILEQYEDSLNNVEFKIPNELAIKSKNYNIKYMLDFETKENPIFLNIELLDKPFEYKLYISENNELRILRIDLVETFNYVAGIFVDKIVKKQENNIDYIIVFGKREEKKIIVIWRNKDASFDPKRDKEFVEKDIIANEEYDQIFVNGSSLIENAISLDEIFKKNMFGE